MELQEQKGSSANTVTAYGDDYIEINEEKHTQSVFFRPEGDVKTWSIQSIQDISLAALVEAAALVEEAADPFALLDGNQSGPRYSNKPELIVIGTGRQQHFLPPAILKPLLANGIGVECMNTQAAARTYNILMSENRDVVAAFFIEA